jgi:hypothetical protein
MRTELELEDAADILPGDLQPSRNLEILLPRGVITALHASAQLVAELLEVQQMLNVKSMRDSSPVGERRSPVEPSNQVRQSVMLQLSAIGCSSSRARESQMPSGKVARRSPPYPEFFRLHVRVAW